ncbi:CYTH domain-containing protein [Cytobacillus sp. Hz8]|uniref:CYTH domain-containing protein n=1 Tax=Cytobacillus sp. Hz8 TaxID=3347168 RepID=UPI0035D963E6
MSQNIEIEFKNLLTEAEFTALKTYFLFADADFKKQENHYFDTVNFALKAKGCALRIREKNGQYEMTLKQPAKEGLLETNQTLSSEEAALILQTGTIISGEVKSALKKLKVEPDSLQYFGSLTTERAEKYFKDGLIVLDFSYYLNTCDFEIEYEVNDYDRGKKFFEELLQEMQIPLRETANKIKRFYLRKQNTSL